MRTITLGDGNSLFLHDEGEALSDHIVREKDYFEIEILKYLEQNYREHDVILDVGANIGNHTVFFATHLEYNNIIAFEPIPENFALLQGNVREFPGVVIRREAVGDGTLDVMMQRNPDNMGACEVTPVGDVPVHQIKLDSLLVNPVTLIKIDVEWYEPFVLLGARHLIDQDKPLILIEDSKDEYSELLPSYYSLIKAWPEHRTYLYGT